MRVRPATEDDLDQILDHHEEVAAEGRWIATEAPIDRARKWASFTETITGTDGELFVAEEEARVIGMAGVHGTGIAEFGMSVAAGQRGEGVGTKLLEACIEWARGAGAHKLTLQVWPHNEAARALYRKFGFVEEGYLRSHYRRRNGELWDCVIMGLVLDPSTRVPAKDTTPPPDLMRSCDVDV